MKYKVLRIDEDLDFGCEERGADSPVMAVVTLVDEEGSELRLRQPDQMLYDRNINEGDDVMLEFTGKKLGCITIRNVNSWESQVKGQEELPSRIENIGITGKS